MIEVGGCWPTHEQELLLKAALFRGQSSLDAFAVWERGVGFDQMDEASFRLLPLLGSNLQAGCVEHAMTGRLKGIHRRAWYENQVLFRSLEKDLQRFHAAGIPCMLLKGSVMALKYYRDAGLRPMRDLDVLIGEQQASAAVRMLLDNGWRVLTPWPGELTKSFRRFRHSIGLQHQSGHQLDLHWHVLYSCCWKGADDDFWAASVPFELRGVPVRVLAPSDQFLHVCVHGMAWDEVAPIRWIADAFTILRQCPDLDWERIVEQTEGRRLALPMREALHYLASRMDAPIPQQVLRRLDAVPVTKAERLDYERHMNPNDLQAVTDTWRALYQRCRRTSRSRNPIEFSTYLLHYWNVQHFWQLGGIVRRWSRQRIRHALAGRSGGRNGPGV